jgi:CRISPR-associated protein Csm1
MNHHVPVAPSDCPHCLALPHPETRVRRGEVYTFSCLSALGPNGDEPLGYLKADVDQMGFLFSLGFVNEDQESATMAQYFTLSQSLDRFFAYYLGQLMVKTYPHLYSVFAGGDDVYVIGRARDILHFAKEMASAFQTYVGDHPDVTLSAGVAFVKPRSPLSRVTAQVEEFLELAKEQPSWERSMHHLSGRNQVTFHGLPYSWPALDQLLEDTERVLSFVQAKVLSMGGMHRLLAWVSQCPRSPSITGLIDWQQGESYRLLPHVAYMLERTWTQEQRRNVAQIRAVHEWISRYFTFVDETDAIRISRFEALMYLLGLFKGKEHEVS